jgi:hypothetical protein
MSTPDVTPTPLFTSALALHALHKKALDAMMDFVKTEYPVGAPVEFEIGPDYAKGVILGYLWEADGIPVLRIKLRRFEYYANPFNQAVTIRHSGEKEDA